MDLSTIKVVVLSILLLPTLHTTAEELRSYQPEDLYRLYDVSDPRISPDSSQVAFVVKTATTTKRQTSSAI